MKTTTLLARREFLRRTAFASAGTFICCRAAAGAATGGVPAQRLEKLATGANICRWFRSPRRDSATHFDNYIPDEEAALISRMGIKHVRLCAAPRVVMDAATGALREDRAPQLEAAIRRFQRAGLLVVLDIHNENRADELSPEWQDAFVKFWTALATRLSKLDPDLLILEIINEPVFDKRETEWNPLNARLAAAIRQSAPQHTIITSGPNWGGIDGLKKLQLLPDRNVIYSFHCYDPFPFTHQGATWSSEEVKPLRGVPYPSTPEAVAPVLETLADKPRSKSMVENYGRQRWNKERLAARFKEGIEWGKQNGVPLYCGEFGVIPNFPKPEHRANWFRDFGAVLAENKIGWAVWGWDEGFGLNRRVVDGKPVVDVVVAEALGLKAV
jgi:endoglucanase